MSHCMAPNIYDIFEFADSYRSANASATAPPGPRATYNTDEVATMMRERDHIVDLHQKILQRLPQPVYDDPVLNGFSNFLCGQVKKLPEPAATELLYHLMNEVHRYTHQFAQGTLPVCYNVPNTNSSTCVSQPSHGSTYVSQAAQNSSMPPPPSPAASMFQNFMPPSPTPSFLTQLRINSPVPPSQFLPPPPPNPQRFPSSNKQTEFWQHSESTGAWVQQQNPDCRVYTPLMPAGGKNPSFSKGKPQNVQSQSTNVHINSITSAKGSANSGDIGSSMSTPEHYPPASSNIEDISNPNSDPSDNIDSLQLIVDEVKHVSVDETEENNVVINDVVRTCMDVAKITGSPPSNS